MTKDPASAELLVVCSDRLWPMAKSKRDRFLQAVLPFNEHLISAMNAEVDEVLDSEGFKAIIAALGIGIQLSWDESLYRPDFLRYGKIIVVSDDSAESMEISANLSVFFSRFMPSLFARGHVYTCSTGATDEEEFARSVMVPESRRIVQFQGA
jgi:DNA gyrase subunit B